MNAAELFASRLSYTCKNVCSFGFGGSIERRYEISFRDFKTKIFDLKIYENTYVMGISLSIQLIADIKKVVFIAVPFLGDTVYDPGSGGPFVITVTDA
jgi:hypothetical protein